MRGFFNLIVLLLLSAVCIASIATTVVDVINNRYFNELKNIKSLNNREKYMEVDYLLIKQTFSRNENTADGIRFDIEGNLLSDNTFLTLEVGYSEYIDPSLEYQPLYKSKLTGYYFLKDAPKEYYDGKYRGLYGGIFFKLAFYIIMPLIMIKIINYRKYKL